jgi:hypothetical protein
MSTNYNVFDEFVAPDGFVAHFSVAYWEENISREEGICSAKAMGLQKCDLSSQWYSYWEL